MTFLGIPRPTRQLCRPPRRWQSHPRHLCQTRGRRRSSGTLSLRSYGPPRPGLGRTPKSWGRDGHYTGSRALQTCRSRGANESACPASLTQYHANVTKTPPANPATTVRCGTDTDRRSLNLGKNTRPNVGPFVTATTNRFRLGLRRHQASPAMARRNPECLAASQAERWSGTSRPTGDR
jgi:hypothetical protein